MALLDKVNKRDTGAGVCLLFFVKFPEPGKVKTRLAQAIGDEAASQLYICFVKDILDMLQASGLRLLFCYEPQDKLKEFKEIFSDEFFYLPQKGRELGDKLKYCFGKVFSMGFQKAVVIGSDLPDLPLAFIQRSLALLAEVGIVIGPAKDGGYYLLAFDKSKYFAEIFERIPWSSDRVLEVTLKAIACRNQSFRLLDLWQDVDTIGDLRDLYSRNSGKKFQNSRTMKFIKNKIKDMGNFKTV
jgi:hypothetical protein